LKALLSAGLNKHYGTIERWIDDNLDDGPLTTMKAAEIISKNLHLTNDEIFEESVVTS
jgi:hypothetical protein